MTALFRTLLASCAVALGAAVPVTLAAPARAEDLAGMRQALTAAQARDWALAESTARQTGPMAQSLVDWQRLRAGQGVFSEYLAFAQAHGDWPGMALLLERAEDRLTATTPQPEILHWFETRAPISPRGARAFIAALQADGQAERADAEIARIWTSMPMDAADQQAFLTAFGPQPPDLNDHRALALLDKQEWAGAQQMLPLVSATAGPLIRARIAVQSGGPGVDALILALPDAQRADAGLAMDRFLFRSRNKLPDLARALMLERSTSAEALRDPAVWGRLRADYARAALRDGDWPLAEQLAANHYLEPGSELTSDLEFLAGYAALKSGATDRALAHFGHLADATTSPISQSRALFWQARAHEAAGNADAAQAAYTGAAAHQSAYYGQLAAEKLGLPMDPALTLAGAATATLPDWRGSALRENGVFQAGVWLFAAGQPEQGQRFFLHLAETASAEDIGRMARLTAELHHPYYALRLAKAAAAKGVVYPAAYFPLTGLETGDLGLPPELVMSIARRESEFNHRVASHAGARGLMQVMPGTARDMAARIGVPYQLARLTEDPEYNARLGAAYLDGLRARFGPSIALVAAGYNAGPGRSVQWTARFGDIRTAADPVDWVEAIPFDETRNYVMRVAESLAPYRARIAGAPVAFTLVEDLTGGGLVPPPPRARQTLTELLTSSPLPPRRGDPISAGAAAFDRAEASATAALPATE